VPSFGEILDTAKLYKTLQKNVSLRHEDLTQHWLSAMHIVFKVTRGPVPVIMQSYSFM